MTSETPRTFSDRLDTLEREMHAERRRYRELFEKEVADRRQQMAQLLEVMGKAIEKMEREDLRIEKDLRTELTRQNRFIYEEFQETIRNLSASVERESDALRDSKIDRTELKTMVRSLLESPSDRFSDTLVS